MKLPKGSCIKKKGMECQEEDGVSGRACLWGEKKGKQDRDGRQLGECGSWHQQALVPRGG